MNETSLEELQETLKLYNPKVTKQLKINTPEDLNQTELFHIAAMKFDFLVPNVSKRASPSEDNTIPRVHCAQTLRGCIEGHAGVFYDAVNVLPATKRSEQYRGGYYIYALPFEFALAPNNRLVFDAELSGEHWLVTYNQDTRFFKPSTIGKFVVDSVLTTPTSSGKINETVRIIIEVPEGMRLQIDNDTWIQVGYWKADFSANRDNAWSHGVKLDRYEVTSKGEFDKIHKERAALLSYETKLYSHW